jgi:hypothetical protein
MKTAAPLQMLWRDNLWGTSILIVAPQQMRPSYLICRYLSHSLVMRGFQCMT